MKSPFIASIAAVLLATANPVHAEIDKGTEKKLLTPALIPGDYVWQPELSPKGPVVIIVSLAEQRLYVYRNGVRIARSTISSGKPGHRTPTGVFTILQKNVVHHSNAYHDASMPYMERLTWGGVAIHAGNLPGYPESHGCVHVPLDFAKKLYTVTEKGTTVFVTDEKAQTSMASQSQPGLLFSDKAGEPSPAGSQGGQSTPTPANATGFAWKPQAAPTGPLSLLFSTVDKQIYVYRDGVEIGRTAVGGPDSGRSYGNHVYTALVGTTPDGAHQWSALGVGDGPPAPSIRGVRKHLVIPPAFLAQLRAAVIPGTTLVITDHHVDPTTRSGPGFNILDTANP